MPANPYERTWRHGQPMNKPRTPCPLPDFIEGMDKIDWEKGREANQARLRDAGVKVTVTGKRPVTI